jgi:hypothetical protein
LMVRAVCLAVKSMEFSGLKIKPNKSMLDESRTLNEWRRSK